jgi:hypothetical protein
MLCAQKLLCSGTKNVGENDPWSQFQQHFQHQSRAACVQKFFNAFNERHNLAKKSCQLVKNLKSKVSSKILALL